MVPAGRAAHCAGAGEPAPQGGLAHTVSLVTGAARRLPGGLGMGANDLPITNWRRRSTFRHHLKTSYVWGYLLSLTRHLGCLTDAVALYRKQVLPVPSCML
jgi:hypothetical protein